MKMSYRQASIIIFYMLVAFKVLSLPSLMYQTCRNDGYFAMLIMMQKKMEDENGRVIQFWRMNS